MKYPYVVASLPTLILGEHPTLSADEFRFSCQGCLSDEDLLELGYLLENETHLCCSSFARAWQRSERHLRLAVAQVRAGRLGIDMHPYMERYRTLDPTIQYIVVDAFARTTPLARERVLDEYRWRVLDELSFEDPFGLAAVLAFGLKLQLADRWAALEDARGLKAFERQLDTIMKTNQAVPA